MVMRILKRRKKEQKEKVEGRSSKVLSFIVREVLFITLGAVSAFFVLSLLTYQNKDPGWSRTTMTHDVYNAGGVVGAWFSDLFYYFFGLFSYLFPVCLLYIAYLIVRGRFYIYSITEARGSLRILGFALVLLSGCPLMDFYLHANALHLPLGTGGVLGSLLGSALKHDFNQVGASLVLGAIFLVGTTMMTGLSWGRLLTKFSEQSLIWLAKVARLAYQGMRSFGQWALAVVRRKMARKPKVLASPVIDGQMEVVSQASAYDDTPTGSEPVATENLPVIEIKPHYVASPKPKIRRNPGLPSLELLETVARQKAGGATHLQLGLLSKEVEARLLDFGVKCEVVAVHPGPVITRFELSLAPGVKVSKVSGLSKDLARALSVESVRVVDVIPGKPVVGLEIPNERRQIVRLKEVLSAAEYANSESPLSMGLGQDISGLPIVVDLAEMPHLLVAGTTGSGKSVGLNAMLLSLLYKAQPEEVRLIMIDPKMLELAVYEGVPHLLAPVVTDMKEAANALRWCVAEMERRYQLLAALGVRSMQSYNEKVLEAKKTKTPLIDPLWPPGHPEPAPELDPLPYIVVVVDEFADMIMVVGKKVEELIARIAQKARAAGIHLILATQRPSVDVITGLIKANVPTRIAFQVASRVDSRTILDQQGAEQLLGKGDMLYLPAGTSVPLRVHGAFVADHEVHQVVRDWKARGEPDYNEDVLQGQHQAVTTGVGAIAGEDDEADPFYDEAVAIVLKSRRASISMVQRRLKIGYNRSARLIEQMETSGVVGPMQSNGQREVLAPAPQDTD